MRHSEDGQGRLKHGVFIDLVCQQIRHYFTSNDILEDFTVIDANGDAKITIQELRQYLESLQIIFSMRKIEEIVDEADLNNDGPIDHKELPTMVCLGLDKWDKKIADLF